jgi:hypothetical protein
MIASNRITLVALIAMVGCHTGRGGDQPEDGSVAPIEHEGDAPDGEAAPGGYPGTLIASTELGGDFMARQKLTGEFQDQEFRFEAVMQLREGVLTVIGLTPFGSKAFVLVQTGTDVDFQLLMDRPLPFPPEYMLQDIHRTWFWHTRLPWKDGAPAEDVPEVEVEGERIREQWSGGALVRRTFERLDGAPAGVLRIDYIGGHRTGKPAPQVVIENGWFGYRLEIETAQWRALGQ